MPKLYEEQDYPHLSHIIARGRRMSQGATRLFATMQLPAHYDYLAPDGSEIRELYRGRGMNMAHRWAATIHCHTA